ncbi:hypothetical protein ACIA6D_17475 [Streptomyces cacaoi]|uniref:SMODS-associated NUDIX domain-containing protein n=1 Tax=Streptomyces cacaoi TaxID=1898 RepID=UPI00374A86A0
MAVVSELVLGLTVSLIGVVASQLWRSRGHLSLLSSAMRPGRIRVSVAAVLRVQRDDTYILFHSTRRPGSYGPPGGALKYRPSGRQELDRLCFQEEPRPTATASEDLRGFIPARSLPGFVRWWRSGTGRESASEGLRRELAEELTEVGHSELAAGVAELSFVAVRTVMDGPMPVLPHRYRQVRFLEVCDLDLGATAALALRQALFQLGESAVESKVICARSVDIEHGRLDHYYIGAHSSFLFGARRLNADLPSLR